MAYVGSWHLSVLKLITEFDLLLNDKLYKIKINCPVLVLLVCMHVSTLAPMQCSLVPL